MHFDESISILHTLIMYRTNILTLLLVILSAFALAGFHATGFPLIKNGGGFCSGVSPQKKTMVSKHKNLLSMILSSSPSMLVLMAMTMNNNSIIGVVHGYNYEIFITYRRTYPIFDHCPANYEDELAAKLDVELGIATCGAYSGNAREMVLKPIKPPQVRRNLREVTGGTITTSTASTTTSSSSASAHRQLPTYWCGNCDTSPNCPACCLAYCKQGSAYLGCIGSGGTCPGGRRGLREREELLDVEEIEFEDFENEMRRLGDVANKVRMANACKATLREYADSLGENSDCMGELNKIGCDVSILVSSDAPTDCDS